MGRRPTGHASWPPGAQVPGAQVKDGYQRLHLKASAGILQTLRTEVGTKPGQDMVQQHTGGAVCRSLTAERQEKAIDHPAPAPGVAEFGKRNFAAEQA